MGGVTVLLAGDFRQNLPVVPNRTRADEVKSCIKKYNLLAGDFRQTLPVVPKGTRADEVKSCIEKSNLWPQVIILKLSENMRAHLGGNESAGRFSDLLLKIGNGDFPSFDEMVIIPEILCTVVTTVQELLSKVYPDIIHIHDKPIEWLCERAILTAKNDQAAGINGIMLISFEGEEKVYTSIDIYCG
nr:uncharacterized protein LOC111504981 [Leptinotarsa decemlineata]